MISPRMAAQDEPSPLSSVSSRGDNKEILPETTATSATSATSATNTGTRQPLRKRRRIIISCTECHRRKQKCDRNLPCTNCVSRNKQDSCRYEAAAPTAKRAREYGGAVAVAVAPPSAVPGAYEGATGEGEHERGGRDRERERRDREQNRDRDGGRDLPRGKRPSKYDEIDPRLTAPAVTGHGGKSPPPAAVDDGRTPVPPVPGGEVKPNGDTNFGYSSTGANALGFLKRIDDGQNPGESLSSLAMGRDNTTYFGTRERYKSLVRQLPARPYIEKLVEIYFKDFNWQYNGVDYYVFERQMDEWYSLPFNILNTEGPQAFPPDLRAFPALLFQVVATGLLILGSGPDSTFDSLKYNSSMTFEDLATDYSESGVALLSLLGKRQVSHTAVVAGWLRAAFLKYSGLVTEAWHALGSAVRDGQECGLHRDSLDPRPKSDRLEDILENQWEIQRRRKTWCLLMVWDVHTGVVLGRPIGVDLSVSYTLPVDAPTPKDPSRTPVMQRSENDPPSLMTRTLHVHRVTMALKDIVQLEREGPCPKDFSKVDRLHERLLELEAQTPAFFRKENPDTRYDDLPDCFWIPLVRQQLHPLVWFNFMALHRPYVFTRPHSRKEALKASLKMLEAQRDNFVNLSPRHYKTFQLFFGTFDAVVLTASIFILFPRDNAEYVSSALQHIQWAIERFETMAERNRLAAAARGVLHAIHIRLQKALGVSSWTQPATAGSPGPTSLTAAPASAPAPANKGTPMSTISASPSADSQNTAAGPSPSVAASSSTGTRGTSIVTPPESAGEPYFGGHGSLSDAGPIDPGLSGSGVVASDWSLPEGFDWGSIQPVYAMADVAYNDLMGISSHGGSEITTGTAASMPNWAGGTPLLNEVSSAPEAAAAAAAAAAAGIGGDLQGWSFGGDFGNDSVWSVLNQFGQF